MVTYQQTVIADHTCRSPARLRRWTSLTTDPQIATQTRVIVLSALACDTVAVSARGTEEHLFHQPWKTEALHGNMSQDRFQQKA